MDSKSLFLSKTFWAALLTVVAAIVQPFGLMVDDQETAKIADAVFVLVGFGGILYGRYKASRPVTVLPQKEQ